MNIFFALTEGRGRLSETNLSAFLAFLLAPHHAHGLSDTFLQSFLTAVSTLSGDKHRFANLSREKIDVEIGLEVRYPGQTKDRIVDIEIKLFEETSNGEQREIHRLIIENKIKQGAAQEPQFKEEFGLALEDIEQDTRITAVFLTPDGAIPSLTAEYGQLVIPDSSPYQKVWLRWNSVTAEVSTPSVVGLTRAMLRQEALAEIEPVSEYTRHTLKAFVQFIEGILARNETRNPTDQNNSGIAEERQVSIDGRFYRLVRFDDKVIKIFDLDTGQENTAKPLLRRLNEEANLGVELLLKSGNKKNTRQLGRDILHKLRDLH